MPQHAVSPITLIQLLSSFNPTRSTGWRYNLQSPDDLSWILDEMGFLCQYLVYNSLLNPNHMFSKVLPCGLCWAVSGKYPLAYLGYNQRYVASIGNIEKAMWVFNCLGRPGCFGSNVVYAVKANVYRVFKLEMRKKTTLISHQKCTFKS